MHVMNEYSLKDFLAITEHASKVLGDFNLTTAWPNDNLEYRSLIVALSSFAVQTKLKLGTAITAPYLRNPLDAAAAFASVSEIMDGRDIYLGVGAGARPLLGTKIERSNPLNFVREFVSCLRILFSGGEVRRDEIPILASYFHLNADSYHLRFPIKGPIHLIYGAHPGTKAMQMAGELCDGVLIGTNMQTESIMEYILDGVERGRAHSSLQEPIQKFMIINSSISKDGGKARSYAKRYTSHFVAGMRDDILLRNGINPSELGPVRDAYKRGESPEIASELIPDDTISKVIITGTSKQCVERISSLFKFAEKHNYRQVLIGVPVGPNLVESIDIWSSDILPSIS